MLLSGQSYDKTQCCALASSNSAPAFMWAPHITSSSPGATDLWSAVPPSPPANTGFVWAQAPYHVQISYYKGLFPLRDVHILNGSISESGAALHPLILV